MIQKAEGIKALVVEDDMETLASIRDTMTALRHEYDIAPCLADARRLLGRE